MDQRLFAYQGDFMTVTTERKGKIIEILRRKYALIFCVSVADRDDGDKANIQNISRIM